MKHRTDPCTGVVPRAAAALFEKLSPTAKSGIRSPNRYSMNGPAAFAALSKGAEKNWKMTATYVEVCKLYLNAVAY